ncbi:MAG: lipopolysaccharide biosynthesis protein [Sphingomonadaceae bacterium]
MTTPMPDAPPQPALADRVRSAVIWRSGSQIAAQLVMWGATIMVVRLLDPHDYGLFAMTQVVLVVLTFLNGDSFASSLIQAESVDRKNISQVFGLLILLNCALAALQLTIAPAVAAYFRQPVIEDMLRVQALLYLAVPFISLPSALLARRLNFRTQAMVNLSAALVAAVTALSCALGGLGIWTLVFAPLALFWVRAIGLTIAARLIVWPSFDFRGAGAVIRFGGALTLCQFFWIIQSQSDIFMAGSRFDPHDLGLYAEALFLTLIFTSKFVPPLNEVAFPSYAQLLKDGGSVDRAFRTVVRLTMLVAMPLYLGMAAVAQPLIETLFGTKWLEMVPLVQMLALAMPFFSMQIIFSPVTNAMGRPGVYVTTSIAGAIIMPIAFLWGVQSGLMGLTVAWLIAAPLLLMVTMIVALPHIGTPVSAMVTAVFPSAAPAAAMAGLVVLLHPLVEPLPAPFELLLLAGFGASVYFGLLRLFARPTLDELWQLVTKRQIAAT